MKSQHRPCSRLIAAGLIALSTISVCLGDSHAWLEELTRVDDQASVALPVLRLVRQDYERLEFDRSILESPLKINDQVYDHGIGTHANSHIQVLSEDPIVAFRATVGVDDNPRTQSGKPSIEFIVSVQGRDLYKSGVMRRDTKAAIVDVKLDGVTTLDLRVTDTGDGPGHDHADWALARITTHSGRSYSLDQLSTGTESHSRSKYPFRFTYDGKSSDDLLERWKHETLPDEQDKGLPTKVERWVDPQSGLAVMLRSVRFQDYPAYDWMLCFENTGKADTPIIENVQGADLTLRAAGRMGDSPFLLHRTFGGPAGPTDFEPSLAWLDPKHPVSMTPGQGRSSSQNFPFFKIDTGRGAAILAIGWSGMWKADLTCPDARQLHITAGLEKTHFKLKPGERVRGPRMLLMTWEGDAIEANAQFRQLIYTHYAAKRNDKTPLPMLFCNTCFTRGGGWLNECNAENQISLINAYAPLGLEALLTDAGWFEGGWPSGAGNWNPRKDAYPQGMGPVALAAQNKGMIYGLWYEPERVVAGTDLHRNHREWLLSSQDKPEGTYLLNFGLPEVQEYFFNIVKDFMKLPGFRFYRQDFNMDPLPYWRHTDAPDRQGIAEMKYIEGLYAYWDRIADAWPDSIREECASGGNRIDLETVRRMHLHQKSDYWFDNETDQAALWGLSQYLPNNVVVAHLNRMDDYSFHSTLASSLCMGWIADAKDFDFARGKKLLDRYQQVRHLLVGAWYPLLPYSRDPRAWIGSQYHRPDLDAGLILVFRHAESPYRTVDAGLRGLKPDATYEVTSDTTGEKLTATGAELAKHFPLTLPDRHRSDLLVYRRKEAK